MMIDAEVEVEGSPKSSAKRENKTKDSKKRSGGTGEPSISKDNSGSMRKRRSSSDAAGNRYVSQRPKRGQKKAQEDVPDFNQTLASRSEPRSGSLFREQTNAPDHLSVSRSILRITRQLWSSPTISC